MISQKTLFRVLLLGLPIGLVVSIVIAVPLYYHLEEKADDRTRKSGHKQITMADLQDHVRQLADKIGVRHTSAPDGLRIASKYINSTVSQWEDDNRVTTQVYSVAGQDCMNIIVEFPGHDKTYRGEHIVVGAHYDSAALSPGADANATGTAALLSLATSFARTQHERTVHFVFFTNGEAPWAGTPDMGSARYAAKLKAEQKAVMAMIDLDSLGSWRDEPGTQLSPAPTVGLFPDVGNFLAAIAPPGQEALLATAAGWFGRERSTLPFATAKMSGNAAEGGSDHLSFTAAGYPAIKLTTTGRLRNPNAGLVGDVEEKIDYLRFTAAVQEIADWIRILANPRGPQG